ncbi:uncharacterized protein LOC131158327 isoform X2 [Malania oleifera]|nr:uncharacterized protein LOC131158327 isoform X2 [Malania oleifera]XP_057969099.1 uncharacterized protein LOC131158327 isoform X2 [Malania oleifera]
MQEVAGERGGYLHGRGALDSDDLLYLKEQMEAEEDAERLLRRTEKRAFAAFKKAATLADSSPASVPLPLRVEPKSKSGIRQQDLLKKVVEIKPKRQKVSSLSDGNRPTIVPREEGSTDLKFEAQQQEKESSDRQTVTQSENRMEVDNPAKRLLGLAYESSEDED